MRQRIVFSSFIFHKIPLIILLISMAQISPLLESLRIENSYADEVVAGFDEAKDLPVLNNELRKINKSLNNIEQRTNYAADTAATDTYIVTITNAPTVYTAGMQVFFKATTANTGACTLNVNNLGAKSLKSLHDQTPPDNYIEAGSIAHVIYDGTNFQILSPDANP